MVLKSSAPLETSPRANANVMKESPPEPNSHQVGPNSHRRPSRSAAGEQNKTWPQYTLKKLPWRPYVTPFEHIIEADYSGSGTLSDPFIVQWLEHDPENPENYGSARKVCLTILVAFMTLCIALASSAYTGVSKPIMLAFGCSEEIFLIGLTVFILGFAVGPLVFGPMSEALGRRTILVIPMTFYTIWTGVCTASQNIQSMIVFRFLAGVTGSAATVIPGGFIADLFEAENRGVAMAAFSSAPFLGPALGPIIGGFMADTVHWRWLFVVLTLYAGALTLAAIIFVPETYAPVLLRNRANLLTKVTGKTYKTKMDMDRPLNVKMIIRTSLVLPWQLLFKEPIVFLFTLYMAVVYGILYLCFAAFPIVFQNGHHWNAGVGGLPFLSILLGILTGVVVIVFDNKRYARISRQHQGFAPPEARLPPMIYGGAIAIAGLAWFAATCGPSVHWIVPILAAYPFGLGFILIFMSAMNYLIDSYVIYAASVVAANSILRSTFGAFFPLFTIYMYQNLGVNWASSIPAFIALACFPCPILFYKYGHTIRQKCKYSAQAALYLESLKSNIQRQKSREEGQEEK